MLDYLIASLQEDFVIIFRMLFALLVGLSLGWERQRVKKSAGIRTHVLVCVSTAMIVSVTIAAFPIPEAGARTIGAIITGIGFLGAGQILVSGGKIYGVTTAASIWMNALIGAVIGLGFYLVGFVGALIALYTFRMKKF